MVLTAPARGDLTRWIVRWQDGTNWTSCTPRTSERPLDLTENTASPEQFVRRLGTRYLFVFSAVALLVAADQAVIQPLLLRMNNYAPVINVAGRQRMLSQKLVKAALALQVSSEGGREYHRTELRESLRQWSTSHLALQGGTAEREINPIESPAILAQWSELEPHFAAMQAAAWRLGDPATTAPGGGASRDVATLIEHEAAFLAAMDRIVALMESEAGNELHRLRVSAVAIAGTIVGLVGGLGWLVIRPATRAIRRQVDELETQVKRRTAELGTMLASLRHEIAQRQITESRNRALAAQLAHADRVESIGHLAAGLAHELNQPLGAIANYADACCLKLSNPLDEASRSQLQDYLEQMRRVSLRAGQIVRRIRNFVRPGPSPTAVVDLVTLAQEVVDLCRPEAERAEVDFQFTPPANQRVFVNVDAIQVQQVLVNLIQNAIEAMRSYRPLQRRLVLQMAARHDAVQVDVVDSGPGLTHDDPELLFAPFRTTKAEGLGIGLSICRAIVEQHQGTIWAHSLPLQGTQFSFVLPIAEPHAAQQPRHADYLCR
jgi:signal transduction histidine kinase